MPVIQNRLVLDRQVWGEHHVMFKERSQLATGLTFLTEMCKDHTVGKFVLPLHIFASIFMALGCN